MFDALPFKQQAFEFLRKNIRPRRSIYQHLHFKGDFIVPVTGNTSFKVRHYGYQIENEIFWEGIFRGWEKVSLSLWHELSQQATTILDIGANTGVYSLLSRASNPKAEIYAFEPVERVHQKLEANNALNGFDIHCIKKAASNQDGTALIYDKDTEHTLSVTVGEDLSEDQSDSIPVEIETQRLDSFIGSNAIKNIDLMKIDVETHEVQVLEGMGEALQRSQPTMLIEILNKNVASGIEELISGMGYEYYNIDEQGSIRKVEHLGKSDYYNFLICKPEIAERLKSLDQYLL